VKPTVGSLTDNVEALVFTEKDMGNVLNKYFAPVFTTKNTEHLPAVRKCFHKHDSDKLCSYDITTDTLNSKLCKLQMNKAPRIDSVGTRMLIELSDEISNFVAIIFNNNCSQVKSR